MLIMLIMPSCWVFLTTATLSTDCVRRALFQSNATLPTTGAQDRRRQLSNKASSRRQSNKAISQRLTHCACPCCLAPRQLPPELAWHDCKNCSRSQFQTSFRKWHADRTDNQGIRDSEIAIPAQGYDAVQRRHSQSALRRYGCA